MYSIPSSSYLLWNILYNRYSILFNTLKKYSCDQNATQLSLLPSVSQLSYISASFPRKIIFLLWEGRKASIKTAPNHFSILLSGPQTVPSFCFRSEGHSLVSVIRLPGSKIEHSHLSPVPFRFSKSVREINVMEWF